MSRTYMYGYPLPGKPQQRLTLTELEAKTTWRKSDPEFRRRLLAMFDAAQDAGHDLGLGGAWRTDAIQLATAFARHIEVPSGGCCTYGGKHFQLRPGQAHATFPGLSYHLSTTADGEALAADLIGDLVWANANCWRFGLLHFAQVNDEPWHHQPVEIPRSRSKYTGQQLAVWPLPTPPAPVPVPPTVPTPPPGLAPTTEAKMLTIVGNEDNKADPRRWVWDGGTSLRFLTSEADYRRLLDLAAVGLCKLHPAFSTLASPFWMSTAERARYGQP